MAGKFNLAGNDASSVNMEDQDGGRMSQEVNKLYVCTLGFIAKGFSYFWGDKQRGKGGRITILFPLTLIIRFVTESLSGRCFRVKKGKR